MAFTFSLNNSHNDRQAMYELKEKLKLAGWTVLASGDGRSSYNPSGDTLTNATGGPFTEFDNSIASKKSWWRIRSPDGRELLWQRVNTGVATSQINIAYSRSAGFTASGDGTPTFDIAPTSTDSFQFAGQRRQTTSSGDFFKGGAGITINKVDYIIGDDSEDYSFACLLRDNTGKITGGIIYDRLKNPVDAADPDPTVVAMIGNYTDFLTTCTSSPGSGAQWTWGNATFGIVSDISQFNNGPQKYPAVNAPVINCGQRCYLSTLGYWNTVSSTNASLIPAGTNPYTNEVDLIEPVYWFSYAASEASPTRFANITHGTVHGESRIIKAYSPVGGYSNMDTNSALTRIAQRPTSGEIGFWFIWDGLTTPVL